MVQWDQSIRSANVSLAEFERVAAGLLVKQGLAWREALQVEFHNAAPKRLKTLPDSKDYFDCAMGEKTNKAKKLSSVLRQIVKMITKYDIL